MRQLSHSEVENGSHDLPIGLVCPDWRDPLNVGAVFRLADAAGIKALVLAGETPHPPHPKMARTARATEKYVPWCHVEDVASFFDDPRSAFSKGNSNEDFRRLMTFPDTDLFLALELTDTSTSILDYQLPQPIIDGHQMLWLIAGNEAHGIDQAILDRCHTSVHLPMYGKNTSMNVGVALGIAVYALLKEHKV